MSVHYKFKSALEYDTITFDGLHISVKDLKNAIIQQKRIGKSTDFDLQVTNAQTKEVYEDGSALIPKNTSLLIARIPVIPQKTKQWEGYGGDNTPPTTLDEGGPIAKAVDLSSLDAPEDDKIKAMMSQSTQDYDPSNYMKIRGSNQVGAVPPNYQCYKCHQGGHWIKDCTISQGPDPLEIRKSTGIPRSFMVTVEGPLVPGAMMTPNGQFAVPLVDHQAYNQKGVPTPVPEPKLDIPEELVCSICSDLLTDAVMIPCCGNSFCDECIRGVLLESEDHECPDCHEKDISPDTLIPNRFLRTSVANFKNTTGYVKKRIYKEPVYTEITNSNPVKGLTPPPREVMPTVENETEQKTIISEADSTESSKANQNSESVKDSEINDPAKSTESDSVEGPPGVSPRRSPIEQRRHKDDSPTGARISPKETRQRSSRRRRSRDRSMSPKKKSRHHRSPSFGGSGSPERKSGTPTVDEPSGKYNPPTSYNNTIPTGSIPPIIGQASSIQPIAGVYPSIQPTMGGFPTAQGPPPNYRFPPPGGAPYMAPGPFNVTQRPMFDARPPLGGPLPNFNPNFPPGSRGHRDYGRRMMDRTPAGIIDDPLAAFNRLLREKDEQKRRAKQRSFRRSYSRSRSRSFSRSPVRRRSRSPKSNRRSRSRSRSFSLSRSRSRSFSGSLRGSPHRQLSPPRRSPPPSSNSRRGPSRYRSPLRSPPRSRLRDRDYDDDRDYNRDDRPFKENRRNRDNRERRSRDRDRDRYYDNFEDKRGPAPRQQQWGPQTMPQRPMQDGYYPPPAMQQGYQTNRFGQGPPHRDFGPPFMNKESPFNQPLPQTIHSIQPQRQYQDIAPPGVDDDIAPPGVEETPFKPEKKESPKKEEKEKVTPEKRTDKRESDKSKRRHEKRSRTPERARNPSPKRKSKSRDRDRDTPDKHRRRRRDSSDREDKDKRRDHSDDERSKKNKDKKKHKDKKESEKRKKRDKKDKHKKEGKEKKAKDEFKQIIPKNVDEDDEESLKKKILSKKKREEVEECGLEEKKLDAHKEEKRVEAVKEEQKLETPKEEKRKVQEKVQEKKKVHEGAEKREQEMLKQKEIKKRKISEAEEREYTPEPEEPKPDLYGEISTEDIDTSVIESYGKLENELSHEGDEELSQQMQEEPEEAMEEGEIKELDDEEKDVLELHTTDMDLKTEIDKSDILAPVPEKSKWENDDDGLTSPKDSNKSDSKSDKSGKVTNEVLKRAENAIFAKAINAIRPIEIKKIGADRAKLYAGEKEIEKSFNQFQVTIGSSVVKSETTQQPPVRLSVKERLGVKVEDTDKVINLSRRSRTISPFSKRGESGRNFAAGERRVEVDEYRNRNRRSRSRRQDDSRDRRRTRNDTQHHSRHDKRNDRRREKSKREDKSKHDEDIKKSKRKRSRSRSESEDRKDRHKKKEKKTKKEKSKKKDEGDPKTEKEPKDEPKAQVASKRKATIDEATFEPDYDESHSEDDDKDKKKASKKESDSSSSESESESSSEEERKKKKHKKHKKKKKRETSSSSSSSSSESDSSESERERKKRKHKKTKKKKRKSKHK